MVLRIIVLLLLANLSFAAELINKNQSIIDSIVHQFDDKSVTQAELDSLWNDEEVRKKQKIARFQIVNQKLYADSNDAKYHLFRDCWESE